MANLLVNNRSRVPTKFYSLKVPSNRTEEIVRESIYVANNQRQVASFVDIDEILGSTPIWNVNRMRSRAIIANVVNPLADPLLNQGKVNVLDLNNQAARGTGFRSWYNYSLRDKIIYGELRQSNDFTFIPETNFKIRYGIGGREIRSKNVNNEFFQLQGIITGMGRFENRVLAFNHDTTTVIGNNQYLYQFEHFDNAEWIAEFRAPTRFADDRPWLEIVDQMSAAELLEFFESRVFENRIFESYTKRLDEAHLTLSGPRSSECEAEFKIFGDIPALANIVNGVKIINGFTFQTRINVKTMWIHAVSFNGRVEDAKALTLKRQGDKVPLDDDELIGELEFEIIDAAPLIDDFIGDDIVGLRSPIFTDDESSDNEFVDFSDLEDEIFEEIGAEVLNIDRMYPTDSHFKLIGLDRGLFENMLRLPRIPKEGAVIPSWKMRDEKNRTELSIVEITPGVNIQRETLTGFNPANFNTVLDNVSLKPEPNINPAFTKSCGHIILTVIEGEVFLCMVRKRDARLAGIDAMRGPGWTIPFGKNSFFDRERVLRVSNPFVQSFYELDEEYFTLKEPTNGVAERFGQESRYGKIRSTFLNKVMESVFACVHDRENLYLISMVDPLIFLKRTPFTQDQLSEILLDDDIDDEEADLLRERGLVENLLEAGLRDDSFEGVTSAAFYDGFLPSGAFLEDGSETDLVRLTRINNMFHDLDNTNASARQYTKFMYQVATVIGTFFGSAQTELGDGIRDAILFGITPQRLDLATLQQVRRANVEDNNRRVDHQENVDRAAKLNLPNNPFL